MKRLQFRGEDFAGDWVVGDLGDPADGDLFSENLTDQLARVARGSQRDFFVFNSIKKSVNGAVDFLGGLVKIPKTPSSKG